MSQKFAHARRAMIDFLRANASLVAIAGSEIDIAAANTEDQLPESGIFVLARPTRPLLDEVDNGLWTTSFHIHIRHKEEIKVFEALGVLQEYVAQDLTTLRDKTYTAHASVDYESIRWSADLSNAPEVQRDENGYYWTDAFLVTRWREK